LCGGWERGGDLIEVFLESVVLGMEEEIFLKSEASLGGFLSWVVHGG
jgi:hypothetical protein